MHCPLFERKKKEKRRKTSGMHRETSHLVFIVPEEDIFHFSNEDCKLKFIAKEGSEE